MKETQEREVNDFFYDDHIWSLNGTEENTKSEKSLRNDVGDFKTIYIYGSEKLAIREYHQLYREDFQLSSVVEASAYVEISFFLGPNMVTDSIDGRIQQYQPYHCYIHYVPKGCSIKVPMEKNQHYHHLDIYLELSHFQEWISTHSFVKDFVEDVLADRHAHLFPNGVLITPEIAQLLSELKNAELDDVSKEYFMKGKIFLLLGMLFQIVHAQYPNKPKDDVVLRADEEQKLQNIASFIAGNLDKFYTIENLSKEFGINEFKLKKGFKHLFHMGIFEYATNLKMQEAKQLIAENKYTFKEIAFQLGYAAPSSFSVSFKRITNFSPAHYRKLLSQQ
ncbi:helix-turn-helix domain-containing protein [Sphingobacterium corticis]|uniref:Helix-turn-helix domain-containing protein n=1 Tax=Sphingobacterium corticis TaxID=1812823 RepID=A0ABW5NJN4_9SPHI